jgi:hypothetical protein
LRDFLKRENAFLTLIQGQGSVFKIREYAQSIPRQEKPLKIRFTAKNRILVHFRFNTPTTFPESGSE